MKLAQVARTVNDIARSEEWYRSVLGLRHLYTYGPLAFFELGGTRLMLVEFANLEPVVDLVPAATMTVNGTAADNAINYTQGSLAARGLVTVDAYESIEFSNKTNLILNGLAGSDEINLNNPSTPTGLTGIIVNGGDPTASDTLIVNSRVGIQEFLLIVPTGTGAGRIQDQGFTTDGIDASYTGIEHLKVVGQEADGDSLGTTNTDDRDVNIVTPAATPDAGRMTGYSTGNVSGVPFAYVPVEYSGFINYVTGFSNVFVAGAEPDLLIVDVRTVDEYAEGHIAGAINIPLTEVTDHLDMLPNLDEPILVVCGSGHRSAMAMAALNLLGYDGATSMFAGMNAWTGAGYEVTTEPTEAEAGAAPEVDPAVFEMVDAYMKAIPAGFYTIKADDLNLALIENPPALIDVRTNSEVEQGIIGGATHIELREFMNRMSDWPEDKTQPVVVYALGHRSAIAMMAMQMLGYEDVRSLAGGVNAWTTAGYPLVTE